MSFFAACFTSFFSCGLASPGIAAAAAVAAAAADTTADVQTIAPGATSAALPTVRTAHAKCSFVVMSASQDARVGLRHYLVVFVSVV